MKSEIKLRDDCNEIKMKRESAGRGRETERQNHNKWALSPRQEYQKEQNKNKRIQSKFNKGRVG